ncbi:MAG: hypothetical protein ACYDCQ_01490 [Dehalococcoidia bacterium]
MTTVHLPPDRAVLTTPGMVGLMERCIAGAEAAPGWQSRFVEIRHRAGLKAGETLIVHAEAAADAGGRVEWRVTGTASDGRVIGEGTVVRERIGQCRQ